MTAMDCSVTNDMADISNNSSKFKMTTNESFVGSFVIIILMMIVLLFFYYVQFFADIDKMSWKVRKITFFVFKKEYSGLITLFFIMVNFFIAKLYIFIFPRFYQIIKYKNGFMFYDMENLYFGNEVLSLKDVYKGANDFSAELKHPHHKFWIHNISGKSYWCHYVFKEDPSKLAAQIEALARDARARVSA
jgi:hypothetical protein